MAPPCRWLTLLLSTFCMLGASSFSLAQPAPSAAPPNAILIVSVSPETLVDGVETEVEVTVAYELASHAEGLVELTSNTLRSQSMSPFASQRVSRGSGMVTLKGRLTARHWGTLLPARLGAFLVVSDGELTQRKAAAHDQRRLATLARPGRSEDQAVNPNPSTIYEDGVQITAISPETFVAGQRIEISVQAKYELLSREEGEISLGFSRGGRGYSVVSSTKVAAGKGEVTLRGWVTPQRTGSLPFGKVHLNLSETPRRQRSAALASDAETVEVK